MAPIVVVPSEKQTIKLLGIKALSRMSSVAGIILQVKNRQAG
jgi:hypothetical protein